MKSDQAPQNTPGGTEGAFQLRKARADDLRAVTALLDECSLPCADIAGKLDGYLVAERDELMCGVVGLEQHGEHGLLRSLAVSPDCRGHGIGSRLVEGVISTAFSRGIRELHLLTTTAPTFFERHGFERVVRDHAPAAIQATTEFSGICPSSAVCMRKDLARAARYFPNGTLDLRADVPGAVYWGVQLDRVMLTYFEVAPGACFPWHAHEAEQITMVLEGELIFELDQTRTVRVTTGEVVAIPSGMPHAVLAGPRGAKAVDAWSPPRSAASNSRRLPS